MRRTLRASGLLALFMSIALAVPSSATTPFTFTELIDVCQLSGGDHGFGYLRLKVRVKEFGVSGANYFRIRSRVEYRDENGAGWFILQDWGWAYSASFPNNSTSYYYEHGRRFDPDGTPDASAHRIRMRVQAWSNSSGLLAERIMYGQKCVTGLP